ncbi:MAG: hypothetical protein IH919_05455 [Deltaproteobacteria bacterium]|nr:hypothetical protein [Deltaproteobacteria bacterium]MCH7913215.1 hypothetical protein [Deltaproteobacteria bacterium]MCZ6452184.1 hypothetical protein [Deltaproteobacteria bacterium]MCZ6549326.1 hypothetical protein [Deltaproteobacteria bacterium]MCZ6562804.1 hypothetical protein [Deltaproteobacteria bacterium]
MSGNALGEGVEENQIEGVTVRIYSPAKTVADCLNYRTKICLDVALEALRDYRQKQRAGIDEVGALRGFAAWLE